MFVCVCLIFLAEIFLLLGQCLSKVTTIDTWIGKPKNFFFLLSLSLSRMLPFYCLRATFVRGFFFHHSYLMGGWKRPLYKNGGGNHKKNTMAIDAKTEEKGGVEGGADETTSPVLDDTLLSLGQNKKPFWTTLKCQIPLSLNSFQSPENKRTPPIQILWVVCVCVCAKQQQKYYTLH